MKNVILIRHAKSNWDSPTTDKKRPLASKGVADAHLVSSHITQYLPNKSIIWSSTAKRAKDTATIFLQNMIYPLESIIYKEELYTFDMNELVDVIKSCNNSYDCVIVFGHNGAITNFVNNFGDTQVENVCTSGFVSIEFDTDAWENIKNGHTKKIVFSKDLK